MFGWELNPAVDRHSYRLSNKRCEDLIAQGTHFSIKLRDGRQAIQEVTPPEELQSTGFDQAWGILPSGPTGIFVWQMY